MGRIGTSQSSGNITRVGDVLFGADRQVAQWVAGRIPGFTASNGARALGVIKGQALAAAVVYERWNGVHVEASIAAEPGSAWASRSTLFSLFFYPFETLGCKAISVTVPQTNLASLNLATKLGFEPEAIIAFAAHDGSALLVLKMFKDRCRWIGNGQAKQCTEAARSAGDSGGRGAVQPA